MLTYEHYPRLTVINGLANGRGLGSFHRILAYVTKVFLDGIIGKVPNTSLPRHSWSENNSMPD